MIIIVNTHGTIVDANTSFIRTFPDFPLKTGETSIAGFIEWLSGRVQNCEPPILFDGFDNINTPHEGGEFSILRSAESPGKTMKLLPLP